MTTGQGSLSAPLRDGGTIPLLGLGTWALRGRAGYQAVRAALEIGYRHVDTATAYGNEDRVGAAVRDSGLDRGQVFVTTKCPPDHQGRELRTLDESLRQLGLDFVDLWLVHWPPREGASPSMWEQFIAARDRGKARAIGVSNYGLGQVDELTKATGTPPAVNQIPWSPFIYEATTAAGHQERDVVLEGYSPLKRSRLDDPTLKAVAGAHGKTPAQVVLRWHLQHGFVAIPKSGRRERMEENFGSAAFELTDEEMGRLDALGRP